MKLLMIYGPPAAGKLTVAQEVAKRTGFKVFHNHLTIDLAKEVFSERGPERAELVDKLRYDTIEAAARADIDLIFTFVYAHGEDGRSVDYVVELVEKHGGEVCFVQLSPSAAELEKRVSLASRQLFSKIKEVAILREAMEQNDFYTAVAHSNNITIDNTSIPPEEVAMRICERFGFR